MDDLAYQIEENPPWRTSTCECEGRKESENGRSSRLTSTIMLKAISSRVEEFDKLPEKTQELHRAALSRSMAVEYVHRSNIGESVGTQAFEDTQTLLKDEPVTLSNREQSQWSRDELETVNTWRALRKFHEQIREEMQRTGMISVQQLCDIHALLLERLHPNNGRIRDTDVFTRTEDGFHYYPCAMVAKQRLYSLIDHHNIRMECFHTYRERMSTEEQVEFIVKCAARLLFEFVYTHPFSDGNGRTCRLLASYVVSLIIPFAVAVYHNPNQPQRSHRDDFIDAIVRCRKNPEEGPRDLAAMILEGIYIGWESLFRNLKALRLLEVGKHLGPIVVMKSDLQFLQDKLSRACKESVAVEKVIDIVRCAISSTDDSLLKPQFGYTCVSVDIDERMSITVDIYP